MCFLQTELSMHPNSAWIEPELLSFCCFWSYVSYKTQTHGHTISTQSRHFPYQHDSCKRGITYGLMHTNTQHTQTHHQDVGKGDVCLLSKGAEEGTLEWLYPQEKLQQTAALGPKVICWSTQRLASTFLALVGTLILCTWIWQTQLWRWTENRFLHLFFSLQK